MTTYQKRLSAIFISFIFLFGGLLIYASITRDKISDVRKLLSIVSADSLEQIIITPTNPNWNINLTLDTIKITNQKDVAKITSLFNNMTDKYRGRGIRKTWETNLILDFKNRKDIKLNVVEAEKGICVLYTNTMGNPKYKCDKLKNVLERLSNYTENQGVNR